MTRIAWPKSLAERTSKTKRATQTAAAAEPQVSRVAMPKDRVASLLERAHAHQECLHPARGRQS